MRSRFIFCFFLVFGANALIAKVEVSSGPLGTRYHFSVEGVRFEPITIDGKSFSEAHLEGVDDYAAVIYDPDSPQLPALRFFFEGEGTISVHVGKTTWSHLNSPRLRPCARSQNKDKARGESAVINTAAYNRDAMVPARTHDVERVGTVRGKTRRLISLYPLRYNPKTGQFLFTPEMEVRIERSPNASEVQVLPTDVLGVVVNETLSQSPSLSRYLEFKKSMGYRVRKLVIQSQTQTPVQIRDQLKAWLDDPKAPLRYVLIIGDEAQVPTVPATRIHGRTDHDYRALDGENYTEDMGAPDVAVGRFDVTNETELAVVVDKQIYYETGDFPNDDWLGRVSFIGTQDERHYPLVERGLNYAIHRYTEAMHFRGSFPFPNQAGGDELFAVSLHATGADLLSALLGGRGFVNYSGHGHLNQWDGPFLRSEDLARLGETQAYPFVVSCACFTGNFELPSFAAQWQRNAHGSIAFWGSVDKSQWDEDDVLQKSLYDRFFGKQERIVGELFNGVLDDVWRHYGGKGRSGYYWETYHLFGDPTTRLRQKSPSSVLVATTLETKAQAIQFQVNGSGGEPVRNARVTVASETFDFQRTVFTNSEGRARVALPKGITEKSFSVSVSGDDLKLWRGIIREKG